MNATILVDVFFLVSLHLIEAAWRGVVHYTPRILWALAELACAASPLGVLAVLALGGEDTVSVIAAASVSSLILAGGVRYLRLRVELDEGATLEALAQRHFGSPFKTGWVTLFVFDSCWDVVEILATVLGFFALAFTVGVVESTRFFTARTNRRWLKSSIALLGVTFWAAIWVTVAVQLVRQLATDVKPLVREEWSLAILSPLIGGALCMFGSFQRTRLRSYFASTTDYPVGSA